MSNRGPAINDSGGGSNTPPIVATTLPPPDVTSSTTISRPTREQYIAAADRVCLKYYQITGRIDETLEPGTPEHAEQVVAAWDSMLNEWAALPTPTGDEGKVDPIIDSERDALRYMHQGLEAAIAGKTSVWQSLEDKADQAQGIAANRARAYGFRVCSRT